MTPELELYLGTLFGGSRAGWYAELRCIPAGKGRTVQRFFRLPDELGRLAQQALELAPDLDVYVGVAPRMCKDGGRDAVGRANTIWVDCDEPESLDRLRAFRPWPRMVVRSGSGGLHGYWRLTEPQPREQVEDANRRLAHALDADRSCVNADRILRVPGTLNHKHRPPPRVELAYHGGEVFDLDGVIGALPEPPPPEAKLRPMPKHPPRDEELKSIPSEIYVPLATGCQPNTLGHVQCPFHKGGRERTPSLHVDGTPWVNCFGKDGEAPCDAGGNIIGFGGRLWGIEPKGAGYHRIRKRWEALLRP